MIVVKNAACCTGCLVCEMVCSFHHAGVFSRSSSSIKVDKSLDRTEKGAEITIFIDSDQKGSVCDLCKTERLPLCVQFCPENVLTKKGNTR